MLTCDPAGGTHPSPAAACAALDASPRALEGLPPDTVCTQIYGGDEEAAVEGTYRGEPVQASFSQQNGCEIDRWERLAPVLQLGGT